MKRWLTFVFLSFLPVSGWATGGAETPEPGLIRPADETDLSEFLWEKRPILVFADTPADPRFREQIDELLAGEDMLLVRDVVVLTDTDPAARSPLRIKYRPRGFQLILVGKDGGVKLRKPFPWSVRELSRSIDKTPLRQQELRDRRGRDTEPPAGENR